MKLSISNIAWSKEQDEKIYELMNIYGFCGLEIAPTRLFPETPYNKLQEAELWNRKLYAERGVQVSSIQSIWYGRNEMLFGDESDRMVLREYTKQAIDFAAAVKSHNLVFGCPRNRTMPKGMKEEPALAFFRDIGLYAAEKGTSVGMEANPVIYCTNYINNTTEALELIHKVGVEGFKLNLDIGTMIYYDENVGILNGKEKFINHIHISEPGLACIERRTIHAELSKYLNFTGYHGFVSIEMGKQKDMKILEQTMEYVKEVFG